MTEDRLPDAGLDQLFRTARSTYHFADRPVPEAMLRELWELVALGPTSANQEPARVVWCATPEAKEKLAVCTSDTNADKVRKAPVTAIIGMDLLFYEKLPMLFPHADARAWFVGKAGVIEESAFRNSSLQGAYLILAARALGLAAGPMSGFDNAKVDAAFFADTSVKSNFICSLGYRGSAPPPYARLPRLSFEDATTIL